LPHPTRARSAVARRTALDTELLDEARGRRGEQLGDAAVPFSIEATVTAGPDKPTAQPPWPVRTAVRGRRVTQHAEAVYLSMPEVVDRYAGVWSKWTIYEWVRQGSIPHVKLPGRRELLFRLDDLEAYETGEVELDTVKLPQGGRLCRPRKR
jgi:excisionase family DNA binding protein